MGEVKCKSWIHIWTCLYACMVLTVSIITPSFSLPLFIVYLVLATPFIYSLEHYIALCLMFSTISYYFTGAYEEIYSMYSILMVLILLRILIFDGGILRYSKKSMFCILGLLCLTVISYSLSQFHYLNGMLRLSYLIIISLVIGNFTSLRIKYICEALTQIAAIMVLGYVFTVILSGTYIDGRLTIANDVNTNTFGMSCAQIGCILLISAVLSKKGRIIHTILCIIIAALALLSGSRGAMLAFIISCIIIIIIRSKRSGKLSSTMFKTLIAIVALLGLAYIFIVLTGLDTNRFSISEVIASGGSRRTLIYTTLVPYVISNGYWVFGYGPGHDCSRQVVMSLINWDYSHSHNLFLESFGELGVGGLIFTCVCIMKSLFNIDRVSKIYDQGYILLAMLICLIINGMAESYFFDAVFWILLAICRNGYQDISIEDRLT